MSTHKWKEEVDDLLALASDVVVSPQVRTGLLNAAEAAHALSGAMSWVQRSYGVDRMQRAAATLARFAPAWSSSLGRLPSTNGKVEIEIALLAVVARSILDLAGPANLRAALAFWATESDVHVWRSLVA